MQMAFIMAPTRVTAVRLLAAGPDSKHAAVAELTSAKLMQACGPQPGTRFPMHLPCKIQALLLLAWQHGLGCSWLG